MAHFHVKKKKGRPYLYVREIARVDGKPKVISQIYIGSPEKVAAIAKGQGKGTGRLKVEEFGALWLAHQIDKEFDLCAIIDSVVPAADREKGPSVGEYFLYCVWNKMVEAVSKNKLAQWYDRTAMQQIRPVDTSELTSQRYWEKWDRVSEKALQDISRRFFERLWDCASPDANCLLFDTTNYYTFMASQTESDLARRGKNKVGRHHLRQIGLGLLVARDSKLPLYYSVYPGNVHDSKHFKAIMDEMFGIVCGLDKTNERLTIVMDKGMNSNSNYSWIDEHERVHFITTYSTYFAKEIAATSIDRFEIVDTPQNKYLVREKLTDECLLAYRTEGEYWGRQRSVVVTYTPPTARKQQHTFESKLEKLRQDLLSMRLKVKGKAPQWRNPGEIKERYIRRCASLHISSTLFEISFENTKTGLTMSFRKMVHNLKVKQAMFGKNIIITDNTDWTTSEIVRASLDRWQVEDRFRQSKDDDLVGVSPVRHWTDSKIRCHLFTCVVAMTYLRLIEIKLANADVKRSAKSIMDDMQHLHSVLSLPKGSRKPIRRMENPSKTQAEVLSAFNHYINDSGVLQPLSR
jgi:transposase